MIAEGDPQEIYVCSQLLEEKDRDKGADLLIRLLGKSTTLTSKTYAANLLTAFTGQSFGADVRRWQNWLQDRAADKDSRDKKKK
jgi:hypothetical protein